MTREQPASLRKVIDGKTVYVHPCWMCKQTGYIPGVKVENGERQPDHTQQIPCPDCKGKKYIMGRHGVPYAA